jgi:EpsI family protein
MIDLRRPRWSHSVGVLLLLSGTLVASKVTSHRLAVNLSKELETIPLEMSGFTGTNNPPLQDNVLNELKANSYLTRTYRSVDLAADLFIAFYAQQRAGESMHSPKHCLPGSGWEIWDYATTTISVENHRFVVNQYSIDRDGDRRLVLYWYQSKSRLFASEYLGKILLARDALLQNSTAAAIVRIIVPDKTGAANEASRLAAQVIPELQRCFGRP